MKNWEGLGYYSRARNLQKAAKLIRDNGAFPDTFAEWLKLPGIGEYTAGAICSIALGLPTPAVDGNVLRVLSRVLGSFEDIAAPGTKKEFTEALKPVYPHGKTSEFTQGLMELGAIVCLPNGEPRCNLCPLNDLCIARKQDLIKELPVKTGKKERKTEEKTVFILRVQDKVAVRQRPEKGLLANLWEFPNLSKKLTLTEAEECFGDFVINVKTLPESVHVFTHIEWHMLGYEVLLAEEVPGYHWISIREILSEKAIPTAFRCYINHLRKLEYEV
jgi:A/G-specific adenine glycosylase